MPSAIRRMIQSVLGRFGYQLVPVAAAAPTPLGRFFAMLKRQGFDPKHIIDVGANTGGWTRCALDYFPNALYTLIEPQGELRRHVQDLIARGHKIEWIAAGAGDAAGVLDFTLNPRQDSSSFAPTRREAEAAGLAQIKVEVRTLDDVVRRSTAPPPEMVKIDAEGLDLKVLAGASGLVGKTDLFLMEAGVGAPSFENTVAAVVGTMAAAGYRLIDVTDMNRSPKHDVLWLCELAFLRGGSPLLDGVKSYE